MNRIVAVAAAVLLLNATAPFAVVYAADEPAPASSAPSQPVPKAPPVCKWPDDGIPLKFSLAEAQVLTAWIAGQDFSHSAFLALSAAISKQVNELSTKYCK